MKLMQCALALVAVVSMVACRGPKRPQQPAGSVKADLKDSVLEGLCGANTTLDTLDVIPLGCDPVLLDMRVAREAGRVLGTFDIGDKVILTLSHDRKSIIGALDLNTLCGVWIQQDSTAKFMYKLGLELGLGQTVSVRNQKEAYQWWKAKQEREIAARKDSTDIAVSMQNMGAGMPMYLSWKMSEGRLILAYNEMGDKSGTQRYDSLRLVLLKSDSLVLKTNDGKFFGQFSRQKAE